MLQLHIHFFKHIYIRTHLLGYFIGILYGWVQFAPFTMKGGTMRHLIQSRFHFVWLAVVCAVFLTQPAHAADMRPDAMIEKIAGETLETIKTDKQIQAGDIKRISGYVDKNIMPHVAFKRMTAFAMGRANWFAATPEQRKQVQQEFKNLLIHTYAGTLKLTGDKTLKVRPVRNINDTTKNVEVRSQLIGGEKPIDISYQLARTPNKGFGWKLTNFSVAGVWFLNGYKSEFNQQIKAGGVDGLIRWLQSKNQANAKSK